MSSEPERARSTWPATEDLTAKARIRNAALELHAAKGAENTTVREVAQAAGVTHGLVVHHFGSKAGLRRAVEQYLIDLLRQALDAVPTDGGAAAIGKARDASVARMWAEHPAFLRYLRRMLVDEASGDSELLDLIADFTLSQVRDLRRAHVATSNAPEQTQALNILMRELAPRLLEPIVERFWHHLTGGTGGSPPELEVKVKPT